MEEFITKLEKYATAAEQAVTDIAPQVWELTLFIIRIQGILWLTVGLLAPVLFTLLFRRLIPVIKDAVRNGHPEIGVPSIVFSLFGGGVSIAVSIVNVCSTNVWLSLIDPKAAIVYRVGQQAGIF